MPTAGQVAPCKIALFFIYPLIPAQDGVVVMRAGVYHTVGCVMVGEESVTGIIIEGEDLFDIILVRSREGIVFDPEQPVVKIAFILVGSADQLNYHLRALMAIAEIVQEDGFEDRWLAAPSPEHLRDLILLSRRQREKQS